jgi:hypothetical protein
MTQTTKNASNTSLQLQRRDFFRAQKINPGTTVICEKGILWLTQSDDLKDYMLKPGDSLVVSKKSNVLIEALSEARVSIVNPN